VPLSEGLETKLRSMEGRFSEIEERIQDPVVLSDPARSTMLLKERGHLEKYVLPFRRLERLRQEAEQARSLLADDDEGIRELARVDLEGLDEEIERREGEILDLLLTLDEDDRRDVIIEIRAGTGGDEACLFAADLFRMYRAYAETRGFSVEVLDQRVTELGGVREIVFEVTGRDVFRELRYESGNHRVQRVPETEAQGRIHTSAVTVAVLPQVEDVEVDIKREDLKIDTFCASGPGGQKVNKTSSAVRIVHLPTGLKVECQDEKSQHKNRARAMQILKSRVCDHFRSLADAERADMRRSQIGSGDRSERIRTYNFPQNRLTDHRINLTIYDLQNIMLGHLDDVIEALRAHDREERLKNLK
jgi:peptide chain release factor 1